jgi:purine-cytosine permease-like protein
MSATRRHRVPLGIERYGVEPVPPELRTTGWRDLFAILFTWNSSPLVLVLGALAASAAGLPVWWAATALSLGALLGSLMLIVVAQVGVDYGLPGQVAMRGTFGLWGARGLTSPYRIVATIYWFAAQALAAAIGVRELVRALADYDLGLVPTALVIAAIGGVLAVVGFDALRYFVRIVMPLTLIALVIMVALFLTTDDPAFGTSAVLSSSSFTFTGVAFATFLTAYWAGQLTAIMSVADFARYARSRRQMQVGIVGGTTLGTFVAAWVGAYSAVAIGSSTPFAAAAGLTSQKVLLAILLVAILAQAVSSNIMNVYQAGLSLVNSIPRLGRLVSTIAVSVVAVSISGFPDLINDAQQWFTHLGNVAAPIAGVILVDYALLKRTHLDVVALFEPHGRYRYIAGINPAALVAVGVGVGVYYAVSESWVKVIWGVGVTAALYGVLAIVQARIWPRLGDAIVPAEAEQSVEAPAARNQLREPQWLTDLGR